MDTPDQTRGQQIAKLAKDVFHISVEERAMERAAEENRVLNGLGKLNNAASYLPALTDLACKQLQKDIITFARIHAREYTRFGLPCDARVEADLDTAAIQMAGGTHARLLGQLNLIEKRTKRQLMLSTSSGHIGRTIASSRNVGVRKGKIVVRRQRIQAGIPPHGVATSFLTLHRQGPEWSSMYTHQSYPKMKFHWDKAPVTVGDAAEDAALEPGWANNPNAFHWDNFKDRVWTQQHPDPVRWSEVWLGTNLNSQTRDSVRAKLLKAHSRFLELSPTDPSPGRIGQSIRPFWTPPASVTAHLEAMKFAFAGIAGVLHERGILTMNHLRVDIPILLSDTAVAAAWWPRPTSEAQTGVYAEQFGHYWFWGGYYQSPVIEKILEAVATEWAGTLLETPAAPVSGSREPLEGSKILESKHGNPTYVRIDSALRAIAQARPKDHEEVFRSLNSRRTRIADAEPFRSTGGWIAGFEKNPVRARAWLSKRWRVLGLPPFSRGPKK